MAVVGAGAAGLYAALCAAREGASVALVSATPLAQTASYWAQGGLAAALAADDSFELHLSDTERAGRGRCAARRRRCSCARRRMRARPAGARRPLRRRPLRAARAGTRGRPLGAAHRARRRQRDRATASAPALGAGGGAEPRIAVLEGARARALWRARTGRCRGLVCEDGRDRWRARAVLAQHWRRRGAVGAHHQPAGLAGHGAAARARRRARRSPTSSSCSFTPPR